MKKLMFFSITFLFIFGMAAEAFSQRGMARRDARPMERRAEVCIGIDNLTSEQETKIRELRNARLEQRIEHRNQMDALRVKKRTEMTKAQPNMDEVNRIIDEISELRARHLKENAAHRQDIRQMLTEEQRLQFDSRHLGRRGQGLRGDDMRRGDMRRGDMRRGRR